MSRRKPLAAVAAVMATLAPAVPATSASAATTAPAVRTASIGVRGIDVPGSLPCQILFHQIQRAFRSGNIVWADYLTTVFMYAECGGAAI
jgi:hypothetical protein